MSLIVSRLTNSVSPQTFFVGSLTSEVTRLMIFVSPLSFFISRLTHLVSSLMPRVCPLTNSITSLSFLHKSLAVRLVPLMYLVSRLTHFVTRATIRASLPTSVLKHTRSPGGEKTGGRCSVSAVRKNGRVVSPKRPKSAAKPPLPANEANPREYKPRQTIFVFFSLRVPAPPREIPLLFPIRRPFSRISFHSPSAPSREPPFSYPSCFRVSPLAHPSPRLQLRASRRSAPTLGERSRVSTLLSNFPAFNSTPPPCSLCPLWSISPKNFRKSA